MIKYSSLLRFPVALLLIASACHTTKNELEVVTRNFSGEIALQQNLQFNFNKDVWPDSLTNRWDSTAFVEIAPAVKGMFQWKSPSELIFSPSGSFAPGTRYTAKVSRKILDKTGKNLSVSNEQFSFHTPMLQVESAHASWTRSADQSSVIVQIDLRYNYEINPAEALNHIQLSYKGQALRFNTTAAASASKSVSFQLMPFSESEDDASLKVLVSKGISVPGSNYASGSDTTFQVAIPSRYTLQVTDISAQHSGTEGIITVATSQPVAEDQLAKMVRLEPAVKFNIAANESGFTITSKELKADQQYKLHVSNGMEGTFGGRMKSDYTGSVYFGKLAPAIHFAHTKGAYLSSQGFRNVALQIVNVPSVAVTVVKVYENNLEFFLRREKSYDYYYDEESEDGGGYQYYDTRNLGDTVFSQNYETASLPQQNAARILNLDFADRLKDFNGVYVILVGSREQLWIQDSKMISISDIGLIVKEERDNIYVFANSIRSTASMPGVKVSLISTTNQNMGTAVTNGDGVAVFKDISRQSPGFHAALVTAQKDREFNFVWMQQCRIETSRYDVGGRIPNATGLNAMIYAERNLYRPGETLHVSTVVRDAQWHSPGTIPVKLRLVMPNGKEFSNQRKTLNAEGSCEAAFDMPHTAITGTYTLEVYSGNDVLLNAYTISIEEFVPDRIKSEVNIPRTEYKPGDTIVAAIQADNLFGTPAAGRKFHSELNLDKKVFRPKGYEDYDFSIRNAFAFNSILHEGKTDAAGHATDKFFLGKDISQAGMLKGNIMATVFDETGRPVHRYANFMVYTQALFIGIREGDEYVSTRSQVTIPLMVTDKNGTAQQNVPVQATVIKKEWHTVIEKSGSTYRYVSNKEEKVLSQQLIKVSGTTGGFSFVPELSGEYEIRFSMPGVNNYSSRTLYAWGWGNTQVSSFEVNNEGNVTIKTDKDTYEPGAKADILFTTPFDGKLLVTIEREHMIEYRYLTTQNKSASLTLTATDAWLPNVYIAATLVRPMGESDLPLTVAHGYKSIKIESKRNQLPVSIVAQENSRSKNRQTITVKTQPGAYVTIAAVDEGILQVKNYQTPDPYQYFYQKVALSLNSYDIYPFLLPEIKTTRSSTGGDEAARNAGLRVNPDFVNRVRLVSYWSGIRQADGSGTVRYDIDLPQFSGDVRVMAFAYKGNAFGSADKHMKVADPIVISTALPRFFSPGDQSGMSVIMSNTTGKPATATVQANATGTVSLSGGGNKQVSIPAHGEARLTYPVTALNNIGKGTVTVSVTALGETFTNETEIGVRVPASLVRLTGGGSADAGHPARPDMKNSLIPATVSGQLTVSKSPLAQFMKNLADLVNYPYGCVEQTTSAAFPQLYYQDLVKSIEGAETTDKNPAYNVQQAINKLQSMQLSDGSLSYWPGGGYSSWWGSVYACHFLLEARKAGYQVNNNTVSRLLQYLKARLQKRETEVWYYNGKLSREVAAREIIYSLYVLAMAGEAPVSAMNYYKANQQLLAPDSKYLLAAAYTLAGQPSQAKSVLPSGFGSEQSNTVTGGSFYSYNRDLGIALSALVDTDPDNPQVGSLAKLLSQQLLQSRYLNTQENAFGILAMGKLARKANKTTGTATILAAGKAVASTSEQTSLDLKSLVGQILEIQVNGNGSFYYSWELSGLSADGKVKEEDSYLKVRRNYFDRNGKPVNTAAVRQNDLIIIQVNIAAQYNTLVENVVISDMLPAGFEVENTRLQDMPEIQWIKDAAEPDYIDFRDDRVLFFTSVTGKTQSFYYMVRAVTPGKFRVGPVMADAMYNGNFHSYHGAGTVTVTE